MFLLVELFDEGAMIVRLPVAAIDPFASPNRPADGRVHRQPLCPERLWGMRR